MKRFAMGAMAVLLSAASAGSAVEGKSWTCDVSYKGKMLIETYTGLGSSGGPFGHLRFRNRFQGIQFAASPGSWTLGDQGFDTVGGSMAILSPTAYPLTGEDALLEPWVHDRLVAEFVNVDLDLTGATLFGLARVNRSESRISGFCTVAFTGDHPTDLFIGIIKIRFRGTAN